MALFEKALSMLRRPDLPKKWRCASIDRAYTLFAPTLTGPRYGPRKELQYMIHSRRKAEIEILSTLKTCNDHTSVDDCDDYAPDATGQPPLLRYLAAKIGNSVKTCIQRHS